jgi:hypothetical protein
MEPVFSKEFFKELRTRLQNMYRTAEQSAVLGVLIFIGVLLLILIQQILLILIYPFR